MLEFTDWGTGSRRSPPLPARSLPWRRPWRRWRASGRTSGREAAPSHFCPFIFYLPSCPFHPSHFLTIFIVHLSEQSHNSYSSLNFSPFFLLVLHTLFTLLTLLTLSLILLIIFPLIALLTILILLTFLPISPFSFLSTFSSSLPFSLSLNVSFSYLCHLSNHSHLVTILSFSLYSFSTFFSSFSFFPALYPCSSYFFRINLTFPTLLAIPILWTFANPFFSDHSYFLYKLITIIFLNLFPLLASSPFSSFLPILTSSFPSTHPSSSYLLLHGPPSSLPPASYRLPQVQCIYTSLSCQS